MAAPKVVETSLGERVCVCLVVEGVDHGWAVGSLLAPDGAIGRIWSLSRPLTYRALEQLEAKGLVRRREDGSTGGRHRTLLSATTAGTKLANAWLAEPVQHLRDVRTELMLKLELLGRRSLDTVPLLRAQRETFRELLDALTTAEAHGEVVDLWRREHARAVRRFLDEAITAADRPAPGQPVRQLRLSARNQLRARVVSVTHGEVMSTVRAMLPDGQIVTAAITKESVTDLDIAPDDEVLVIVKSTEIMLAK